MMKSQQASTASSKTRSSLRSLSSGLQRKKISRLLATLHRKSNRQHGAAPHKPILLLALLDEIQRGAYRNNLNTVTAELVASFRAYWQALVSSALEVGVPLPATLSP